MNHPICNRLTTFALGLLLLFAALAGCDGLAGKNAGQLQTQARELTPGTRFQDPLRDGGLGPEMIVIPPGRFLMGEAPDHRSLEETLPVHEVTIARPFALSVYEITNAQYVRFLNAMGHRSSKPKEYDWVVDSPMSWLSHIVEKEVPAFLGLSHGYVYEVAEGPDNEQRPVAKASWYGAQAYADWLSEQTGHHYRLPTEAEWEYATKAGTSTWYWWGNDPGYGKGWAVCNQCGSRWDDRPWREQDTAPVGSFEPNPFGLYDVHGNAWEWVQDCWHPNYEGAPTDGSAWMDEGDPECRRVLRGGAITSSPASMPSIDRNFRKHPGSTVGGIRLARDL